jgi:hypothetical protein
MAASHPVAGEDVKNGKNEKTGAGGNQDDIEHGGKLRDGPPQGAVARYMTFSAYKFAADLIEPA